MKTALRVVMPLLILVLSVPAFAKKNKDSADSSSFDRLKSLVGTWTATLDMDNDGKTETYRMVYRTTSGGTALEETIFAGSPKEMISVYHMDNGKVLMTHYCMLNNQPRLQEIEAAKNFIKLDMRDITNASSPKDPHMGGLTVTFKDKDHIEQSWVHFNADGTSQNSVFSWTREK